MSNLAWSAVSLTAARGEPYHLPNPSVAGVDALNDRNVAGGSLVTPGSVNGQCPLCASAANDGSGILDQTNPAKTGSGNAPPKPGAPATL